MPRQVLSGARIFDGTHLHDGDALLVQDGRIGGIVAPEGPPSFDGGYLVPSFVDLQVNGGGGIMLDGDTDAGRIAAICATHILQGCAGVLPTLITDRPEATTRVIRAATAAARANVPGFLGLHLEGPHLDPARKGAHDPALIRPMDDADLRELMAAAEVLPTLMLTVAPEAVSSAQIAALAGAGAIVCLGHSACTHQTAREATAAGARGVTHLFNAMSQLGSREPGLVGAVLEGTLAAGIIADGIHVAPATLRVALAARPRGLFLVSDSMAFAGTTDTEMTLNDRLIVRRDGVLTLPDGTLAGADLRLDDAVGMMVRGCGLHPAQAFAMAAAVPAAVIGRDRELGHLSPGRRADFLHLDAEFRIKGIWWRGTPIA